MKYYLCLIFCYTLFFSAVARVIPSPAGLTTHLLRAPEKAVITCPEPAFGWIFPHEGIFQTGYRIMVATSPGLLVEGKPDYWDSGKVLSENSVNVIYRGKPLKSNSSFWWTVQVWGEGGTESSFSQPQQFITGDFNRSSESWPGQSNWVKNHEGKWVAENKQMADIHVIEPAKFELTGAGHWFADFGKAAFATLELEVTSETEGEKLMVYLGERKNSDKTVNKSRGFSFIGFFNTEIELKKGTHSYRIDIPRHDTHYSNSQKLPLFYPEVVPFRYAELVADESVIVDGVRQAALFYYFEDDASAFSSSNNNLNKIWDLCKYTLKATPFLSLYADGNRERKPYEADAFIQQLGHYAVDREYSVARNTIAFLLFHGTWPSEWQMHMVRMAHHHWMNTGDTSLLGKYYDILKKKTLIDLADPESYLISTRTGKVTPALMQSLNTIVPINDIVDWPAGTPEGQKQASNAGPTPEGDRDGYVLTDYNTVANAFHCHTLTCMAEIAGALGKTSDREFFESRAGKVKQSILKHFFDTERKVFTDGISTSHSSLHANMFPLAFNLVPEEYIPEVAAYIKTKGMACSVYGAQYLLEALYNAGEAEYALALMTSKGKRSWNNMLNVGSSMTTEAWDEYYKPNITWNHAWGSAPANIIPRRLMGIMPVEPGYRLFAVNPQPQGLDSVSLKVPTIRGTIECNLAVGSNRWQMELTVPGNTEAMVLLPSELQEITINKEPVKPASQLSYMGMTRNLVRLKGGRHQIFASK